MMITTTYGTYLRTTPHMLSDENEAELSLQSPINDSPGEDIGVDCYRVTLM